MNIYRSIKKFLTLSLALLIVISPLSACKKNNKDTTIRLNEVTHSIFYAPLYVAIENGYFSEENIKIELTNGGGADASMTALLSKTADIGLMGPETVIYVNKQNKKDAPIVFGQLTQRDGSFLVSRNSEPNFKWEDLEGKEILAGRRGGVPAMTFEYILNEIELFDGQNVTLNYDVQFNLMTSAFIGGTADYCTVFEPTASEYEKQGIWHVVASVGEQGGEIPYTSFIALESYIEKNNELLKKFIKAIDKAFKFIEDNTSKKVAEAVVKQFPSTTIDSLEMSVESYKKIDAWKRNMQATEASFNRLQDIMINAGELTEKSPFNELVNNNIVKEIIK